MKLDWRKLTRKKPKIALIAACSVSGLILVGLFVIAVIDEQNGYSIDPTDPVNYFTVAIINNTSQTERVTWVNTCVGIDKNECAQSWTIAPRSTVHDTDPRGGTEQYKVYDQSGQLQGCLDITFAQSQAHGTLHLNTFRLANCN